MLRKPVTRTDGNQAVGSFDVKEVSVTENRQAILNAYEDYALIHEEFGPSNFTYRTTKYKSSTVYIYQYW